MLIIQMENYIKPDDSIQQPIIGPKGSNSKKMEAMTSDKITFDR